MALIQTINPSDLYHMACKMGRGDNFGYNGWQAIGDYLEQLSEDLGENIEVDILGICCEYSIVKSVDSFVTEFQEFMDSVDPEDWGEMDEEEKLEAVQEFLEEKTSVVVCESDCIIWQAF